MAKTTQGNQGNKGNEVLEDPNVILDGLHQSEEFFKRNRKLLLIIGGAVIALAAGIVLYQWSQREADKEAQAEMSNAVFSWEADSLDKAIKEGLPNVADGSTDAANLAKFYSGVTYLKKGKFDQAIEYLEDFSSSDLLLQGRAYCLLGDAYMEKNQVEDAIKYYTKAAEYKPTAAYTPEYCIKAGFAYEQNKQYDKAVEMYDKIIDNFPLLPEATDARKYKAHAEALSASAK